MKPNTYDELKRLAVNLGYAKTIADVPGEDTADVLSFINDSMENQKGEVESNDDLPQEESNDDLPQEESDEKLE